jgi:hypothetical protein
VGDDGKALINKGTNAFRRIKIPIGFERVFLNMKMKEIKEKIRTVTGRVKNVIAKG